ncbi:MAG: HEAT repeat domain-containing protein [Planctomycetes bacterium]|nr:HEAT repeat domain-containing protein [Planctomycetota bacterium]
MKTLAALALLGLLPPYIDGGGGQITLPEIILEFHTVTLVEAEKADPARGACRFRIVRPLKGKLPARDIKLQISWEGAAPAALKNLKPGQPAVFFTQCYDKRSLIFIDGLWAWTQPAQDGWENGGVRQDFEHVFVGKSAELADAVTKLLRGNEVVARCLRQGKSSEMQWVRYSLKTPNDKVLARDPSAPPARNRPLAAWVAELEDPKPPVRVQAGLALAEIGPAAREAEAGIVKALKDKDAEVRHAAILALGSIGAEGTGAIDGLAQALFDENWFVRFSAAQALQKFGPGAKAAAPALVRALQPVDGVKDFRPIRCGAAMVALSRIDPAAKELEGAMALVVQKLLNYEGDGSDGARAIGAEMLGDCGPVAASALPALLKRLKDEEGDVRVKAAEALIKIAPEKHGGTALAGLAGGLKDPDLLVRVLAAEVLGRLGPRAKEAAAALAAAIQDPEPEVRQAAREALKKVDPYKAGTR